MEAVQRRATKLIPGYYNLSYEERLRSLNLPTLAYRRYRGDMIELFKLSHDMYDEQVTEGFLHYNTSVTRGHRLTLAKKRFRTNIGKYSFKNRVVDHWNSLPEYIINAESVLSFEIGLDNLWKGSHVMFDPDFDFSDMHATTKQRSFRCAPPNLAE